MLDLGQGPHEPVVRHRLLHRSPLASGRRATCLRTYTQVNGRPKVTNRHLYTLFAAILTLAFTAGTARADLLTGDPRQCSYNNTQQCAKGAAKTTLVKYMRAHVQPYWSNPVTCSQTAASLLKWRCSFGIGTAVVWFRGTSTGWKRVVTVTMNP